MALGMPDLSKLTTEVREQTTTIVTLLTEVRDLLREVRDQGGPFLPPKPEPCSGDCKAGER